MDDLDAYQDVGSKPEFDRSQSNDPSEFNWGDILNDNVIQGALFRLVQSAEDNLTAFLAWDEPVGSDGGLCDSFAEAVNLAEADVTVYLSFGGWDTRSDSARRYSLRSLLQENCRGSAPRERRDLAAILRRLADEVEAVA